MEFSSLKCKRAFLSWLMLVRLRKRRCQVFVGHLVGFIAVGDTIWFLWRDMMGSIVEEKLHKCVWGSLDWTKGSRAQESEFDISARPRNMRIEKKQGCGTWDVYDYRPDLSGMLKPLWNLSSRGVVSLENAPCAWPTLGLWTRNRLCFMFFEAIDAWNIQAKRNDNFQNMTIKTCNLPLSGIIKH